MTLETQPHWAATTATLNAPATVFVVDDDPLVTSSLQALLSLETPHQIEVFNHPHEALAALSQFEPEVVLSDFLMPGLNGIAFLKQVKQQLPEATCMLLTGYADKENAIAAINEVGIYRYIEKPWDNTDLLLNLQNGLERARLVRQLRENLSALTQAHEQLETYSQQLEQLVEERTTDLRLTYQKLQSIVQHATDGIVTLNPQGHLTSFNPAVALWLEVLTPHLAAQNLMGRRLDHVFELQPPTTLEDLLISEDSEWRFEVGLGQRHLDVNMAPLQDGEGGFVLMLRDVTQQKETERLREDFVSTLTHDLRTPLLAAIQTFGFLDDESLGVLNQRQHQMMQMLSQSHKDLLGMVNTLLEVYKYEAGQHTLVCDTLDLPKLLNQVLEELLPLAQAKNQRLVMKEAFPASVWGDRQELRRVWVNLIGNAIHHTAGGGQIEVKLEVDGPLVRVCVADNGQGIPAEDVPRLFARFSQGTSRKRNSGTGLGLYLSRQIIEAHHGRIWVETQTKKQAVETQTTAATGSQFYVSLPVFRA